jgi:hypothetical protein
MIALLAAAFAAAVGYVRACAYFTESRPLQHGKVL